MSCGFAQRLQGPGEIGGKRQRYRAKTLPGCGSTDSNAPSHRQDQTGERDPPTNRLVAVGAKGAKGCQVLRFFSDIQAKQPRNKIASFLGCGNFLSDLFR